MEKKLSCRTPGFHCVASLMNRRDFRCAKSQRILLIVSLFYFWSVQSLWAAQPLFTFQGDIDLQKNEVTLILKPTNESSIIAKAQKAEEDSYNFSVNLDHVKTPLWEFSSQIQSSLNLVAQKDQTEKFIRGQIQSQYSLVNFKPIDELSGQFEIRDRKIQVIDLTFGRISGHGMIDLTPPYKLDLSIALADVNLDHFLSFWVKDKDFDSSGAVTGDIKISGNLTKPYLKGSLESFNGFVDKLEFDSIYLNLEGLYPQLKIAHSTVSQTNGMSFTFEGPINLNDHDHFKKQIAMLSLSPLVSNSATEREWTIKSVGNDETGKTEIKYILRKSDETNSPVKEESGILGVQRTMEF